MTDRSDRKRAFPSNCRLDPEIVSGLDRIALEGDPMAFLVAYGIARSVNHKTGKTFVGQDYLSFLLNVSRSSVRRSIKQLKDSCHIFIEPGRQGPGYSNTYSFPTSKGSNLNPLSQTPKGSNLESQRVKSDTVKGQIWTPNLDLNYRSNLAGSGAMKAPARQPPPQQPLPEPPAVKRLSEQERFAQFQKLNLSHLWKGPIPTSC